MPMHELGQRNRGLDALQRPGLVRTGERLQAGTFMLQEPLTDSPTFVEFMH